MIDGTWLDIRGMVIPATNRVACARALVKEGMGAEGRTVDAMLSTDSLASYVRADGAVVIESVGEWVIDAADDDLWTVIAPYVTPGATIIAEEEGEDGREYDLYLFASGHLYRMEGQTVFDLAGAKRLTLDEEAAIPTPLTTDAVRVVTGTTGQDAAGALTIPLCTMDVLLRPR